MINSNNRSKKSQLRRHQKGFLLIDVLAALAVLGFALVVVTTHRVQQRIAYERALARLSALNKAACMLDAYKVGGTATSMATGTVNTCVVSAEPVSIICTGGTWRPVLTTAIQLVVRVSARGERVVLYDLFFREAE